MLTGAFSLQPPKDSHSHSGITRARISASLLGKTHTAETRALMSASRSGHNNRLFGKRLPEHVLDAAAIKAGTPIYVYDLDTFTLVNGIPFRSIRDTAKYMPISTSSLPNKLDSRKSFKGYFYFSTPQSSTPS